MILEFILTLLFTFCGWCNSEQSYAEVRDEALHPDYDSLVSLEERYPYSQIKGFFGNPYSIRHTAVNQPQFPSFVPYNAAREYGLPGLGYVVSDPYNSDKYSPSQASEQVSTGYSISPIPEEEDAAETPTPTTTTTTPRPTKPPLPPPLLKPPPPPPPPFHSTNAINLAPPRVTHRLPKLPPKPHTETPKRANKKKPKNKTEDIDFGLWRHPYNDETYPRRVHTTEEEEFPQDNYRYDLVNGAVVVSDPNTRQNHYYELSVPFYPGAR